MQRILLLVMSSTLAILTSSCSGGDGSPSPSPTATRPPAAAASSLTLGAVFTGVDPVDTLAAIAVGDFNGDGAADLALGAAFADGPDNSRPDAGEVYAVMGPIQRTDDPDAISVGGPSVVTVLIGASAGDNAGRALLAADVTGDGIDDLIVGAPAADPDPGRLDAGRAYFYAGYRGFGDGPAIDLATDDLPAVSGAAPGDSLGYTFAAGDFNGDDSNDVAISAFLADGPDDQRPDAGEVHVINGPVTRSLDLTAASADATVFGADAGDRLGESLATGDFNGDGRSDLVAAAPFADGPDNAGDALGETYVLIEGLESIIDVQDAVRGLTVYGIDDGDQLGHSSAMLDFDGDGYDDLLLGAVSADGRGNEDDLAGEVALVLGTAAPPAELAASDDSAIIHGVHGGRLGRSVATGDLNGDGYGDALLAASEAPGDKGEDETGAAYVAFGGPGGAFPGHVASVDLAVYGRAEADNLATQVNGIPATLVADLDGDGLGDFAVAAPRALEKSGEVLVFFSAAVP